MVETPDFPLQPYDLKKFFIEITEKFFLIYKVTEEDKTKTEQYKSNIERTNFQQGFTDFAEYLSSLEISILLQKANSFTIPRIAQMTQKTNQFNLTSHRYTEGDISSFVDNGDEVYSISVKDKFGDNGITGLVIIKLSKENLTAEIDSLLLSCRILGKGIEEAFLNTVLSILKADGFKNVKACYLPTSKNEQVKFFFENMGFLVRNEVLNSDGSKYYFLDLTIKEFTIKKYYKIEVHKNERKN
jgi:FkbH-like protein